MPFTKYSLLTIQEITTNINRYPRVFTLTLIGIFICLITCCCCIFCGGKTYKQDSTYLFEQINEDDIESESDLRTPIKEKENNHENINNNNEMNSSNHTKMNQEH